MLIFNGLWNISREILSDSLHKNSIFLVLSNLVLAFFGFFFWVLNSRLYSPEQIGVATTLISISGFITNFSMLGLNTAMIKFIPREKNASSFISSALISISIAAIILACLFIIILPLISPPLAFILNNHIFLLIFAGFMVVGAINNITDSIFIAGRVAKNILIIYTIVSAIKLLLPVFFKQFGFYGIFFAYAIAVSLGMIMSLVMVMRSFRLRIKLKIDFSVIRKVWRFSIASYVAGLIGMIPQTLAPLIIINFLGAGLAAYFYMPNMIIQLLLSVPRSSSSSFLAEGSQLKPRHARHLFFKSLRGSYLMLLPLIAGVIIFGRDVLLIFGKNYSNAGYMFLVLSVLSLLFGPINYLMTQLFYLKQKTNLVIWQSIFSATVSVIIMFISIKYGLIGLGIGNIVSHGLLLGFNLILVYFYMIQYGSGLPTNRTQRRHQVNDL